MLLLFASSLTILTSPCLPDKFWKASTSLDEFLQLFISLFKLLSKLATSSETSASFVKCNKSLSEGSWESASWP